MKYTKDKNIYAFENGYKIDVNTGAVIGLRGKPVQMKSVYTKFKPLLNGEAQENNAIRCLRSLIYYHTFNTSAMQNALSAADRLDSLKLFLPYGDCNLYTIIGQHFTEAVEYMRSLEDLTEFTKYTFESYLVIKELQKKMNCDLYEYFNNEQIGEMVSRFVRFPILEQNIDIVRYYLIGQRLYKFTNDSCSIALEQIKNYLTYCERIQKTPVKTANFIREYVETKNDYLRYKEHYDAKQIQENYQKHKKAWEFTYGDYTIVIPTCGEDIIREGQLMHHCVGTYVNRVVENITYICFVRKTASPNDCYITCQVDPNGKIGQYFLSHDRYISSEEDIAFKRAFQEYLNSVWEA